jgi:hypothetical protein
VQQNADTESSQVCRERTEFMANIHLTDPEEITFCSRLADTKSGYGSDMYAAPDLDPVIRILRDGVTMRIDR